MLAAALPPPDGQQWVPAALGQTRGMGTSAHVGGGADATVAGDGGRSTTSDQPVQQGAASEEASVAQPFEQPANLVQPVVDSHVSAEVATPQLPVVQALLDAVLLPPIVTSSGVRAMPEGVPRGTQHSAMWHADSCAANLLILTHRQP